MSASSKVCGGHRFSQTTLRTFRRLYLSRDPSPRGSSNAKPFVDPSLDLSRTQPEAFQHPNVSSVGGV